MLYEKPLMDVTHFDEDIRTNVIDTSTGNVDFVGPNENAKSLETWR